MGSSKIGPNALRSLNKASVIYFSAVSILEIEMKRMKSSVPVPTNFYQDILDNGFAELKLTGGHALGIRNYSNLVTHDPFDRILLAAADSAGLPFMTGDKYILDLNLPFVIDAQA